MGAGCWIANVLWYEFWWDALCDSDHFVNATDWLTECQDGYSTGLWLRVTVSVVVGGCVGVLANSTIKRLTAPISCSVVLHTPHPHHYYISNVIRCTSSWQFRSPRATSHTSPQLYYRGIYLSKSCSMHALIFAFRNYCVFLSFKRSLAKWYLMWIKWWWGGTKEETNWINYYCECVIIFIGLKLLFLHLIILPTIPG